MGFVPSVFSVVSPFVVLARLKVHSVCGGALTGAICFAVSCVWPLSGHDDGFVSRFLIIWVTASSPGLADHIGRLYPFPLTALSSLHISSSIFFQS